jgi:hypothetical protein
MALLDKVRGDREVVTDTLTQQELSLLLRVIHENTFEGKDVLLLADVVVKLQNQLKAK